MKMLFCFKNFSRIRYYITISDISFLIFLSVFLFSKSKKYLVLFSPSSYHCVFGLNKLPLVFSDMCSSSFYFISLYSKSSSSSKSIFSSNIFKLFFNYFSDSLICLYFNLEIIIVKSLTLYFRYSYFNLESFTSSISDFQCPIVSFRDLT